jgi:hypothetical protein
MFRLPVCPGHRGFWSLPSAFQELRPSRSGVRLWLYWLTALRLRPLISRQTLLVVSVSATFCAWDYGSRSQWPQVTLRRRRGQSTARFEGMSQRYADPIRTVALRVRCECT